MKKTALGIVLLIFGFYLVVINPIVSVLVHVVFNVRIEIPPNPFIFWFDALRLHWLWITILVAGLGVVFVKYGRCYVLEVHS